LLSESGKGEVLSFLDRIWSLSGEKLHVISFCLFLITVIMIIPLQRIVIGDNLTSSDEFSYLFQSKVILKGKLYVKSPEPIPSFCAAQAVNNGKWYSKYTTGWPLLLATGSLLNIPWIMNCILSGIVIVLIFYLGREIYDGRTGIIAAFFLLLSPMFLLNGLTLYPHTSHLLFILLFSLLFFRSLKQESKWYHPFLAGISLGFALLIRPAGTMVCASIFFIYSIMIFSGSIVRNYPPLSFPPQAGGRSTSGVYFPSLRVGTKGEVESKKGGIKNEEKLPLRVGTKGEVERDAINYKNPIPLFTINNEKKMLLRRFMIALGGFALGFIALLIINKIQNGLFTTFAYNVYDKSEKWGMSQLGHDYIKGLWNTIVSTSRLGFWTTVFMLESAVIALFEKKRENYFLFALILVPIAFFMFFYSLGVIEFGPRFYFVFLGFLAILASRGIILMGYKISKKFPYTNPVHLFLASALLYMLISTYPQILKGVYGFTRGNSINIVRNLIKSQTPLEKKSIVFLRSDPYNKCSVFNSNLPGLDQKIVTALFLDPETNELVRKKFKDRSRFILDFDYRVNRYIIRPDYEKPFKERDDNTKVQDLIYSSYNYARSVLDKKKAIEQVDRAFALSHDNINLHLIKASILMDMKDFLKAIPLLEKVVRENSNLGQTYFALGICYLKSGYKKSALSAFKKFMETRPTGANAVKARFWILYLQAEHK